MLICHNVSDTSASMRPDTNRFPEVREGMQSGHRRVNQVGICVMCGSHESARLHFPCAGISLSDPVTSILGIAKNAVQKSKQSYNLNQNHCGSFCKSPATCF
uniref:Uncharacterized protein n=1 Tax=Rhipicephalus zambeziensis TaxID=60191 RepID=A0A224YI71_9ACAR